MPPPARGLTIMSGNFDCPEATEFPNALSRRPSIHRTFNPYRFVDSGYGSVADAGGSTMSGGESPGRARRLGSMRRGHGGLRGVTVAEIRSGRASSDVAASAASVRAQLARNSLARSTRSRLHQHRLRRRTEDDSVGTVQDAVDQLNEANSDLSSILDEPLPQILSSEDLMHLVPDTEVLERRHKRRKLDSDALDADSPPQYGHPGQIHPARLKMSILGYDGGYITDENCLHRHYSPENVLRNDKTVYWTEKDECNIILKHWRETPFSTTKIVIKTPDMGFTAPVQEGLIFVSMAADQLLAGSAPHQISRSPGQYLPERNALYSPNSDYRQNADAGSHHPSLRSLGHPIANHGTRPPSRRRGNVWYSTYNPVSENPELESGWRDGNEGEANPLQSMVEGNNNELANINESEYRITASCDDPSEDDEEAPSPTILLDHQGRRHLGHEWSLSDDDTDNPTGQQSPMRTSPREIRRIPESSDGKALPGNLLAPLARFFIERKRNTVSIKFEPPIAGRYVLIKMWSPENRDSIVVQSVSVYGFAGPRFVPALQLR